ncbi:FxsA family protein [Stackebrandtia nassauensis]|uniref:FxsA cytoplasmic membrane protein n=1 Tax=Stackebrandtia nassauensis (strain DSM 44728 / CIP 108903 / NRRL B-16338 / NBRC 102104 / LLR-40K-21) TaxID=446470 RepID=D3PZR0_STANL|nr:FxsA family protein [Stackebrandtia nassauensis]ADD43597.1 FxsA cytoplasmic membrane protein [Stackebrandtia nassauensis DSM 44728]
MTSPHEVPGQPRRPSYRARLTFAIYAAAELVTLYLLWTSIGPLWTILLFGATTVLGIVSLGAVGTKAARDYREAVSRNEPPGPAAISGTIGVVGAILLILPGFLTDVVGLLCVFPPTRFLWRSLVTRFVSKRMDSPSVSRLFGPRVVNTGWGTPKPDAAHDPDAVIDGEVLDGEVVDVTDDKPRPQQNGPRQLPDSQDPLTTVSR